jgi:peptidoglycan/xylan/chitin deacetylase (PgdA/CDA1 family)
MAGDALVRMLAGPPFSGMGRPLLHGRASIFMLHRLRTGEHPHGHSEADVHAHVSALRRTGARFVGLGELFEEAHAGRGGRHAVAFTIDDGFEDQATLARAFLAAGVPVTVFLVAGFLDRELWPWDDQLAWVFRHCTRQAVDIQSPDGPLHYDLTTPMGREHALHDYRERMKTWPQLTLAGMLGPLVEATGLQPPEAPPDGYRPLTWETVRALEAEGVDFGAHSRTHRIFSQLDDAGAAAEIRHSLARVRAETRKGLPIFAWPTGRARDFGARDIALLRAEGVRGCVATDDDYAHVGAARNDIDELYRLKRFSLPRTPRDTLQYGTWIERAKQLVRGQG